MRRFDKFDQEDYLLRTGAQSRPSDELSALALDVAAVLETLPPELRDLCRRLMRNSITEVSRTTGIPRSTLYGLIHKVRTVFEDAGLRDHV